MSEAIYCFDTATVRFAIYPDGPAGGRVIAGGRIPVQSLLAALDESEPDYVRS